MANFEPFPVAVIGAGPIGLAAAAHLIQRGVRVRAYEAGASVGAHIRDWGHVRLFSPWGHNIDEAAKAILLRHGWQKPCSDSFPTGRDLVESYLQPLAGTPEVAAVIEVVARVTAITRYGVDKVVSPGRQTKPFELLVTGADGRVRRDLARAVIDASGTWATPNPLGTAGIPADGESAFADRIAYGIPDVLGRNRASYAGRTVLVVGAGHSAAHVLLDLARLAEDEPGTSIVWATRRTNLMRVYGGGRADQLPARGELGSHLKELVDQGRVTLVAGLGVTALHAVGSRIMVHGESVNETPPVGPVDRVVAATGQRPDLTLTRELRVELDPWLESTKALGPLIDPNLHSCGSVPPHGHRELSHPEQGFYTVGVKSYGRAPTFLLRTGYEQARSVAAALAGDEGAADAVQLLLPETGVCSTRPSGAEPAALASNCCSGSGQGRQGSSRGSVSLGRMR